MKYFNQVTVDSPEEAARFEAYLKTLGYVVSVGGPYELAWFDLKDVSGENSALFRFKAVYVVTGTQER